ncbi:MAG: sodium:solute symporter family protein [Clostridiaceae bacterium]|nr:sodium:solute symporter family protein [Clostridiaceae bacterium]
MPAQVIIVLGYLIATVILGIIAKKNAGSPRAFHGSGLGVIMCVAAGTGEWLGGTSTTGVSEYGYDFGISGAWYTLANSLGIIVLAFLFAELYRSLETVTVPGIIEKYTGIDARLVSSLLLTFVMIAVGTSQIVAAGTLGTAIFEIDYIPAVLIMGTGFIIYTLAGGMVAVGYTNVMHLIVMYGGVILAIFLAATDIGGIAGLKSQLPESYFDMTAIGLPKVSSWIIASILGACTAQAGIQPILAARDVKVAKKSAILTAFVVAPFGILTALLGMTAKVKFPDLANGKLALPTLLVNMNPVAGGIILASILAAVLSTISPIILAAGTMITNDIYKRRIKPDATDKKALFVSRLTTAIAGILCMVIAILLYDSSRILDMVYFAYTLRGSLFVVLLLGIFWSKTSEKGAIIAMIVTASTGLFWVTYKAISGTYPIHPQLNETYISVLVALVTTVVSSLLFKKDLKEI